MLNKILASLLLVASMSALSVGVAKADMMHDRMMMRRQHMMEMRHRHEMMMMHHHHHDMMDHRM